MVHFFWHTDHCQHISHQWHCRIFYVQTWYCNLHNCFCHYLCYVHDNYHYHSLVSTIILEIISNVILIFITSPSSTGTQLRYFPSLETSPIEGSSIYKIAVKFGWEFSLVVTANWFGMGVTLVKPSSPIPVLQRLHEVSLALIFCLYQYFILCYLYCLSFIIALRGLWQFLFEQHYQNLFFDNGCINEINFKKLLFYPLRKLFFGKF